jgi:hypothetical protein
MVLSLMSINCRLRVRGFHLILMRGAVHLIRASHESQPAWYRLKTSANRIVRTSESTLAPPDRRPPSKGSRIGQIACYLGRSYHLLRTRRRLLPAIILLYKLASKDRIRCLISSPA